MAGLSLGTGLRVFQRPFKEILRVSQTVWRVFQKVLNVFPWCFRVFFECYKEFAQASALQSVAIQTVDRQQRKWSAIFTNLSLFLFFLSSQYFSWNFCSNQNTYFVKVDGSAQKPWGKALSRPFHLFWVPPAVILNF